MVGCLFLVLNSAFVQAISVSWEQKSAVVLIDRTSQKYLDQLAFRC